MLPPDRAISSSCGAADDHGSRAVAGGAVPRREVVHHPRRLAKWQLSIGVSGWGCHWMACGVWYGMGVTLMPRAVPHLQKTV